MVLGIERMFCESTVSAVCLIDINMAAQKDRDVVLRQLVQILSADSMEKGEKLASLRMKCHEVVLKERRRAIALMADSNREYLIHLCEFSSMQFPRSQKLRSGQRHPVS